MAKLEDGRSTALRALLAAALIATSGAAAASCVPGYIFGSADAGDDAGGFDATVDAGRDSGRTPDSASSPDAGDATPAADSAPPPPVPQLLLDTVGIDTQTGNAQQQHLVFARNSGRWWLFYIDADARALKTRWSLDFAQWTDGAALALPMRHGGEGRNFSVAYRDFGGIDVLHVATSLHDEPKRVVWDTRATIAGSVITFGAPVLVHDIDDIGVPDAGTQGNGSCDPDGTGVAIAGDGRVYVATAWVAVPGCCYCDSNVATSTGIENGSSGIGAFESTLKHFTVPGTSSAHQILSFSTGNMLGGWEAADDNPPTNVRWATKSAGVWTSDDLSARYAVYPETTPRAAQAKNDWSLCRIDDNNVHAVRRKLARAADGGLGESRVFEHYTWNGGGWTLRASLADDKGLLGSGVVLLTNGKSLLAATIADDATGSVRYATYDGRWSAWATLAAPSAARRYLSGSGCGDPLHPALIWTEGAGVPYRVIGAQVAALIP